MGILHSQVASAGDAGPPFICRVGLITGMPHESIDPGWVAFIARGTGDFHKPLGRMLLPSLDSQGVLALPDAMV